jgi:glutathione synthase/RimK-type ligase-like ATP-grasp enzyme
VLVQEFVPSLRELRIFAIGGRLLTFAVEGTAAGGIWTDPGKVKVACTLIPGELERPLLSLIQRWNLDVAAFDVLETSDGPVFLEVNPVCGWLFFESRAHSQLVSAAVADFLVGVWEERLQ